MSLSVSTAGQQRPQVLYPCIVPSPTDVRFQMGVSPRAPLSATRFSNDNTSRSCLRRHNKPAKAKTSSKRKTRKITHTFAVITFIVNNQQLLNIPNINHFPSGTLVQFFSRSDWLLKVMSSTVSLKS